MNQTQIDFTPGLIEQFPDYMDCVRASVYNCGVPFKAIAADLDMSVSELSRRLTDDPKDLPFQLRMLPGMIAATNDTSPVQWLVLRFMTDPSTASQRALRDLAALAPTFIALASNAGLMQAGAPIKARR